MFVIRIKIYKIQTLISMILRKQTKLIILVKWKENVAYFVHLNLYNKTTVKILFFKNDLINW